MIRAVIYTGPAGEPCGFVVENHGNGIACAAVSMLCINTINCLEVLTDARLQYAYNERGGYMACLLPGLAAGQEEPKAALLIDALALGLRSASEAYSKDITLAYRNWNGESLSKHMECKEFKR